MEVEEMLRELDDMGFQLHIVSRLLYLECYDKCSKNELEESLRSLEMEAGRLGKQIQERLIAELEK